MLQYLKSFSLALLLSVGIGSVGHTASFDCNKATTETEIAICSDPELSALDDLMGALWRELDPSDSLVVEQKEWLKQRDNLQLEGSSETDLEYLYYKYLPRITILMGQLNQSDVISLFKNNDYWGVDHTASETAFIFTHKDFQFLFVLPVGITKSPYVIGNYMGGIGCERTVFSIQKEDLLIEESCNRGFLSGEYFDSTYTIKNGNFILSEVSEGSQISNKFLHADYEIGITSVEQRPCGYDDENLNCFLEPTEFTYSFNNQKRFVLGNFSRQELPHKNRPIDFEKTKPEDYFKRFSQDKYEFKGDYSYPNLTRSVTSFIANIQTENGQNSCGNILSGYSKVATVYTVVFSGFSDLRDSFLNDDPIEFTPDGYLYRFSYSVPIVSLSRVLNFLNSYSATENIVSFWFHKLDEDTKRQLSLFSKYALEYRKEKGTLLNSCFGDFEKIEFWVPNSYRQKNGEETEFRWEPINKYLDGFWERRSSDGTAEQVQSILQLIAD